MTINKLEIEKKAIDIRKQNNVSTNGIKDIFSLVENMGVDLIRYPFGEDALLGFSTIYKGRQVIVSNSSVILAREIFTIAHELAHIIFDFTDDNGNIIVETQEADKNKTLAELRANYFAACFLMPEEKISSYLKYILKKEGEDITCIDIVRMQLEFQVSYAALLRRLEEIGKISLSQKEALISERDNITLRSMFETVNADMSLLEATKRLIVPASYYEYVVSNYKKKYIPKSSFDKALGLLSVEPEIFLNKRERTEVYNESVTGY